MEFEIFTAMNINSKCPMWLLNHSSIISNWPAVEFATYSFVSHDFMMHRLVSNGRK
jgi:hypothetical protein